MIKMIILGLVLGGTLGVSFATEVINRVGLHGDIYLIALGAVIFATLLVHRGIAMIIAVSVLTIGVLQPEQVLMEHGLDKDLLLAALLVVVLYPVVYRVMRS